MGDTNVASKTLTAKPLGVLSRTAINRNVKLQDIDSLPLPQELKDDCFASVARDRSGSDSIPDRTSLQPCDCSFFKTEKIETRRSKYPECLAYQFPLPGLATDAEWLELPDRESLYKEYESTRYIPRKKDLEACLNTLRFDPATGLGEAHEWIRRYLYYRNRHGWFHLSVCPGDLDVFVRTMKQFELVVLPYGRCCSDGRIGFDFHETMRMGTCNNHNRHMIVAVKNDDESFKETMIKAGFGRQWYENVVSKIEEVETFVKKIASVSRPRENDEKSRHEEILNPMPRHAVWWMLLLVPHEDLDKLAVAKLYEIGIVIAFETMTEEKGFHASTKLGIENCVVRFYPSHLCIGDPVDDVQQHISQNKPFVYWFGGKVLNVAEMLNVPSRAISSERQFVRWCVSREMNTLLNLNGDSWVDDSEKKCESKTYRRYEDLLYEDYGYRFLSYDSDGSGDDSDESGDDALMMADQNLGKIELMISTFANALNFRI